MAYRLSSPREALMCYFGGRRGPRAARQRWGHTPSSRSYNANDDESWLLVGALLHGRVEDGGCGIEIDSPEEAAVKRWAMYIDELTWTVQRVEEKMRRALRREGLMAPAQHVKRERTEDGRTFATLVEEKEQCA